MSKRDVSPEKQPRKQSKKAKKNSIVFSTEKQNKIKIKPKTAALCYASKKPIHTPILLRHLDVSRKKNQTHSTEPEIIDCAPPENGSKTTRTLELELPLQ